jgi:hypothetical protein
MSSIQGTAYNALYRIRRSPSSSGTKGIQIGLDEQGRPQGIYGGARRSNL